MNNSIESIYFHFAANEAFNHLEKVFERVGHNVFDRRYQIAVKRLTIELDSFCQDLFTFIQYGVLNEEEADTLRDKARKAVNEVQTYYAKRYEQEIGSDEYEVQWVMNLGHSREEAIQIIAEWDKDE